MKIKLINVSKEFKKIPVLKNVNLEFEEGKIYGFIGRNGSGKSVLLKIMCNFYEPTTGQILFDDVDIVKEKTYPTDTRALIEAPSFLPDLTGFENLKLLAAIQNKITDEDIIKTLKLVNLEDDMNKKYSNYSLGMKQKLGIAQVLMEDPKVIILDEPFNGVENETVKKLRKVLLEEKKKGKIIILASHIKDDIDELADVVYEVDAGIITEIRRKKQKK